MSRRAKKGLSNIPTLAIKKTEQTKDPKKLQRLSFSEEFHEKVSEEKIKIKIEMKNGEIFEQEMNVGETVRNLIKIIEAKYNLPKDVISLSYNDSLLLSCLSFSDIPELMNDQNRIVQVVQDD